MFYTYLIPVIEQTHLTDTNSVNNVAELLMKGGFIMIPIILLSILSVYLFIERYLYIRKAAFIDQNVVTRILNELRNNSSDKGF